MTTTSLLPGSFDYVTDVADFGIRYAGDNSFIALAYHLSEFASDTTALTWETPFIPTPGAEFAALAQPPDNSFQQISLSGNYRLAQHPTVLAYSAAIGDIDEIAMMHLDTLAGMDELKICRAYRLGDREVTFFPADVKELSSVECVYETAAGWDEDLSGVTNYEDLPKNTRDYIQMIEDIVKVRISIVGVGPKRSQAIFRD